MDKRMSVIGKGYVSFQERVADNRERTMGQTSELIRSCLIH